MKFLILNRHDPLSPKAGGAELFTGELAKNLVKDGHQVIWFASGHGEDDFEGVKIRRKGNIISVIYHAYKYYRKNPDFDYVIDEIHAYPYFTRFFVPKSKRLVLIHEVTGVIWFFMASYYTFGMPIGLIGNLLEKIMFRFFYHNERFFTVSESTKHDLITHGIKPENITILSEGITVSPSADVVPKSKNPSIVYFGGMRPLKRVEHQLAAVKILKQDYPYLKLNILGRKTGKYYENLVKIVRKLGLQDIVEFTGFLSTEERDKLIKSSWMTLGTSVKEGWGLAISEAGAFGVPAVVYKTHGNVDAVKHLETGLHTTQNTPEKLAQAIRKLIEDEELRNELGEGAKQFSTGLSWEKSYNEFKKELKI